ncbi:unnamed protein product, partial [Porites evermanni]
MEFLSIKPTPERPFSVDTELATREFNSWLLVKQILKLGLGADYSFWQTPQSSAEYSQTVMKTTDGRDKDILDKQGVETDAKDREESLKDTPISRNSVKESQQTLFPREEQDKRKAKITLHTIEEALTTNEERTP